MENTQGLTMNGVPVAKASALPVGTVAAANVEPVLYDEETSSPKEKQGGKCCGCCCDYRRAVIIINGLLILGSIAEMVVALAVIAPQLQRGSGGGDECDLKMV